MTPGGALPRSLCVGGCGRRLRGLLRLDDHPICDGMIVTALRVVGRGKMGDAYRRVATALYGEGLLHGEEEGRENAAPRAGRAETDGTTDEAAVRRVRSDPGGNEDPAD